MAKQKRRGRPSGSGKHKTPRINVGIPADWHAVIRKLAAKREQPVVFLLISLAATEAAAQGMTDLPPKPWEEEK